MARPLTRATIAFTLAAAIFALLFAAYLGSYYALLNGKKSRSAFLSNIYTAEPVYRCDHEGVEVFFGPANAIDRGLRPTYWRPPTAQEYLEESQKRMERGVGIE